MKDTCHLTISKRGIVRMTKGAPSLSRGELAVKVAVSMSDAHFAEPAVSASIEIPDSAIIRPAVSVEVETPASVDTRPEGGDADAAPFTSGAVAESETPNG